MSYPTEWSSSSAASATAVEIHVCGTCRCTMVQAVERDRIGSSYWQMLLRCPECEWSGTGVFTDAEASMFDIEFESGTAQLLADLHALGQGVV